MVSIRYPSSPGGVDAGSIIDMFNGGFDRAKGLKDERDGISAFGGYLDSIYGAQGRPQTLSDLASVVSPSQSQNTVQRAPLPDIADPATARVEQAFAAQGQMPSVGEMSRYIVESAKARGIDPRTALRVARAEGLGEGIWQSNVTKNGAREPSFGPFQMLVGGGDSGFPEGLGNAFQKQTGLDPSDPKNWRQSVDFALDTAGKSGWGQWYGAKAAGIDNMQGINGAPQSAPVQVADASGQTGFSAPAPQSILPPRDVMLGLFKSKETRPFAIQLAQAAQGLRADANDPMAQIKYQTAVEELKQLRAGKKGGSLINAGDGNIYDPTSGQWITAPNSQGGQLFEGKSVQATGLNYLIETGELTKAQAAQLAAGKTITNPEDGSIMFMTPQGLVKQPGDGEHGGSEPNTLTGPKKPTDTEYVTGLYADRMTNSGKIIDDLEEVGTGLKDNLANGLPLGNYMISDEYQKFDQAQRDFINAVLRRESGAVISPEEFDNARKQYLPQPGDTKDTLAQKRSNRQTAIQGMRRAAGPGFNAEGKSARQPENGGVVDYRDYFGGQ